MNGMACAGILFLAGSASLTESDLLFRDDIEAVVMRTLRICWESASSKSWRVADRRTVIYLRRSGSTLTSVYPSSENESPFLRSIRPKGRFSLSSRIRVDQGRWRGGGAGRKFVTHSAGFDEYFTMRADQTGSLIVAVNDDVLQRLLLSGASISTSPAPPPLDFTLNTRPGTPSALLRSNPFLLARLPATRHCPG